MKKDSFTFSDKLKKSKTLPLSKRIPSRVGGEVKAKRTLFERAQRDLPFIIVAALALLLLPFLSREAGDIDTPSVVWGDGSDGYLEEFNKPESAEGDIALSSFRNPLDLIIRHGEGDSASKDTIDTYNAGDSESMGTESSSTRSTYGSEDYSSSPATSRYGRTVKRSVRNSVNRVPTAIGAFRPGSMVAPNSGSGVGHSMAFGSRARDAANKVQGPGVRPVALQPLTASGKGRKVDGNDALYAEAARSIGAMNTPGAKQALLDAQLKDIDGKPLDYNKSAGAAGAGKGPGAGGGPSNNWTHNPIKPWWWDMMKDRSQKRWELWHYNWEKMASDSLIKLTAGLASCLIAGSNDFGVNNFLGKPGGASDYVCVANGEEIEALGSRSDFVAGSEWQETQKDGSKTSHVPSWMYEEYNRLCEKVYNGKLKQTVSDRQNFFDVRLRCLGLKLSELKAKFQTKRTLICQGLYEDPPYITVDAIRNGKSRPKKMRNAGFYVVNKKGCITGLEEITEAQLGGKIFLRDENKDYTQDLAKVVVFRVGKYGKDFYPEGNEDPTFDRDLDDYKNSNGAYHSEEEIYWESGDYDRAFNIVSKEYKTKCLTEKELQERLKPVGKWKKGKRFNTIAECNGGYLTGTKIKPVEIAQNDSIWSDKVPMIDCITRDAFIKDVPSQHKFSATIKNPGKRTISYVLEKVQGNVGNGIDGSAKEGYIIKQKIDYSVEGYKHLVTDNGDGSKTFVHDVIVGMSKNEMGDAWTYTQTDSKGNTTRIEPASAKPGIGKIIWITTDDMNTPGLEERNEPISQPSAFALFPSINQKAAVCNYRWGCGLGDVCNAFNGDDDSDNYCFVSENGQLVYYQAVFYQGYHFIKNPKTPVDKNLINNLGGVKQCDPLCKYLKNGKHAGYGIDGRDPNSDDNMLPLDIDRDPGIYIDQQNCPDCNPEPKVAIAPSIGLVCIDPKKGDESCPCIKVDNPITPSDINPLYIRSEVYPVNPQEIKLPVTPICAKKAIALGKIYLRKDDGTAGEKVNPDRDIVDMLLRHTPAEQEQLCPFCNPEDEDIGEVCVDPLKGNEPCPCVKVDNPRTPGVSNPLFVRSDITPVAPKEIMLPVTPICYKEAIARGNIYVRNIPDGTAGERVDPDDDIVTMLRSKPKDVRDKLCPVCNPDPVEVQEAKKKCEFIFKDVFDHNVFMYSRGYQDVNQAATDIAECVRMTDIAEINVIGHADKSDQSDIKDETTCPVGDPNCDSTKNNISLSEDRALYITNAVLNKLYPTFTGKVRFAVDFISNPNAAPKTFGKPRYSDYKRSYGSGNRVVTFKVIGRGDADATVTPIYDRNNKATNKEAMAKDRYVEILPFRYESD